MVSLVSASGSVGRGVFTISSTSSLCNPRTILSGLGSCVTTALLSDITVRADTQVKNVYVCAGTVNCWCAFPVSSIKETVQPLSLTTL